MSEREFLRRLSEQLEWPEDDLRPGKMLPEDGRWDSVALLSVMTFVEEELDLSLSAEALERVTMVDELLDLIRARLG